MRRCALLLGLALGIAGCWPAADVCVSDQDCFLGESCTQGVCEANPSNNQRLICTEPASSCGTFCADLSQDEANCGSCGRMCAPGQLCQDSSCQAIEDCAALGCTGLTWCDPEDGTCKPGCERDDQCPELGVCALETRSCACEETSLACDDVCAPCPQGEDVLEVECDGARCVAMACAPGTRACPSGCCPEDVMCPDAKIVVELDEMSTDAERVEVQPQSLIRLGGAQADVGEYQWTLVARPPGSPARLIESRADGAERGSAVELFVERTGTYVVELEVSPESGGSGCARARVEVAVIPTTDIYVELTWEAPGDTKPEDELGVDLDLHYKLFAQTPWNTEPWDIFWFHPTANWGERNREEDNPFLEPADDNGLGPEIVRHDQVVDGLYQVAVYYFRDGKVRFEGEEEPRSKFGAANARVRVYLEGEFAAELERELESVGTFWRVLDIDRGEGRVRARDRVRRGIPGEQ